MTTSTTVCLSRSSAVAERGDRLATIDMDRKLGAVPRFWGAGSPSNTMSLGRGLPPYQVVSWCLCPFGHNRHGPKTGGCVPLFFWGGGAVSPSNIMSPGPTPASVPSGILIHPTVWPQQTWAEHWGGAPFRGELGPHLTQCCLLQGLPPYQVASWSIQPFGQTWAEIWGLCPFRESCVPISHNVAAAEAYLHAKFHLDPSSRLATIHRRCRQADRQTGQTEQRSGSIGRTVLQTVAQKNHPDIFLAVTWTMLSDFNNFRHNYCSELSSQELVYFTTPPE